MDNHIQKTILIVSGSQSSFNEVALSFQGDHFQFKHLYELELLPTALSNQLIDLLIIHFESLKSIDLSVLKMMKAFDSKIPCIVISNATPNLQQTIFEQTNVLEVCPTPLNVHDFMNMIMDILYPHINSDEYYELITRSQFVILRLFKEIPIEITSSFYQNLVECVKKNKHIIVDLQFIQTLNDAMLHCFDVTYKLLNMHHKKILFLHTNSTTDSKLQHFGFVREEHMNPNILHMLENMHIVPEIEKFNFTKSIVLSTINTMFVQNYILCNRQKSYLVHENKSIFPGEIGASIKITIESHSYYLSICATKSIYLKILSNLLNREFFEISTENKKGIGEILQVIVEHTKDLLSKSNSKLHTTGPYIHQGNDYKTIQEFSTDLENEDFNKWNIIVVPFLTTNGDFFIQFGFPQECSLEKVNLLLNNA